jgi:hypothetical protein
MKPVAAFADSRWMSIECQAEWTYGTGHESTRRVEGTMNPSIREVLRFSWSTSAFVLTILMSTLGAQSAPRALFNGKNLDGWEHVGPGSFVVEDGLLKTRGGMGLLWYTQEKIQHATVRVVFRLLGRDADSGLFIRIPEKPSEPWMPVNRGYEAEIGDWPDEYSRTGVLYSFTRTPSHLLKPFGEWNTMEVTVDGPHTIIFVNGEKVTDFHEGDAVPAKKESSDPERGPRPDSGYIGLQNEPGPEVDFKEVSLLPLQK